MPQFGGVESLVGALLIFLLIALVIFLITREAVCWYFKINERLGQMQKIETSLDAILSQLRSAGVPGSSGQVAAPREKTCPGCGKACAASLKFCESCGAKLA